VNDVQYLGASFAMFAFLIYKLGVLRYTPPERRATILPACVTALFGGLSYFLAAPTVAINLDRLVLYPNFSTLLVQLTGTASMGTICVMVLYWHYPRERAWRASRWWVLGTISVNVALTLLFVSAPRIAEHRNIEFPTAAARVPYLREYVLLYLAAWIVAEGNAALLCWRFAAETPEDQPRVRRGLKTITYGLIMIVAYFLVVVGAVIARWFDTNLDYWTIQVAPSIFSLGAVVATMGIGFVQIASVLESVRNWLLRLRSNIRDYRTLRPLWQALKAVDPSMVHKPESLRERLSIESRLFWRVIEINDWLHQIRAHRAPSPAGIAATDAAPATAHVEQIEAAILTKTNGTDTQDTAVETANAFASELTHLLTLARGFTEHRAKSDLRNA